VLIIDSFRLNKQGDFWSHRSTQMSELSPVVLSHGCF